MAPGPAQQPQRKEFPYNIPADEDVEVRTDLVTVRRLDENSADIFCAVCTFPMHIKVKLIPCNHLICPECFEKFNQECKFCGFEIADVELPNMQL